MKTLLALSLVLILPASFAADRDDRILRYGAGDEPEYPHEVIQYEDKAAEDERAYKRGVIDQHSSDDGEHLETFNPAYQKGVRDGIRP